MLFFAFCLLTLCCLTIILWMTRPTPEQKSMDKRIIAIKAPEVGTAAANAQLQLYRTTRQNTDYEWVEKLVANSMFSSSMQLLIMQADSKATVGAVVVQSIGTGAVGAVVGLLLLHTMPLALAAGGVATLFPFFFLHYKRGKRLAKFNDALPDAVDMMARSLRAGHSLAAAISIVAEQSVDPVKTEFGEVFKKQNYGLPMRDALMQMLDRVPSQDLKVLVTGMMVQRDTGGNLVDILERIVAVVRDRQRIKREISTHTAQGRMTGYILCALPLVLMFLINMVNPGYSNVLFDDPFGREILYVGAGLLLIGGFVIRQIINGIEI
jgi:tight adherence protein B